jgi:hypothetical protein
MTTKVTISNSEESATSQEAVVTVKNSPVGGNPEVVVLKAGDKHDFWLTSNLTLEVSEREAG